MEGSGFSGERTMDPNGYQNGQMTGGGCGYFDPRLNVCRKPDSDMCDPCTAAHMRVDLPVDYRKNLGASNES